MEKKRCVPIAQNKKAYHDYFVEESMEAGIELCGRSKIDPGRQSKSERRLVLDCCRRTGSQRDAHQPI